MHRILQRRRVRKLRVVWASLALLALSLAACSALFTAWTWRQTRDLSQSFKTLQDRLEQVCCTPQSTPPLKSTHFSPDMQLHVSYKSVCYVTSFVAAVTGIRAGGKWLNATPHFTPYPLPCCTYSILLHHLTLLFLTNESSQVYLCGRPPLFPRHV